MIQTALSSRKLRGFSDRIFLKGLPLVLFSLFVLLPFYWTLATSFKQEASILEKPIRYLPLPGTLENYRNAFEQVGFQVFFWNSLLVSAAAVSSIVVLSIIVSYALSRFDFRGKQPFLLLLLATQFVPGAMLLIPLFLIFKTLGLIGTPHALILTYITFQLPFNAVLMRGFFSNIPKQIDEAAMIDGCNRLQTIFHVLVPILLPGIVSSAAFGFIGCWNEFLFALMLTTKASAFTIPVGLSYMMGQYNTNYAMLAAAGTVALIPPIALFAYIQRYLVSGLSAGSVKG